MQGLDKCTLSGKRIWVVCLSCPSKKDNDNTSYGRSILWQVASHGESRRIRVCTKLGKRRRVESCMLSTPSPPTTMSQACSPVSVPIFCRAKIVLNVCYPAPWLVYSSSYWVSMSRSCNFIPATGTCLSALANVMVQALIVGWPVAPTNFQQEVFRRL